MQAHRVTAVNRCAALVAGLGITLRPVAAAACPMCYGSSDPAVLHTYYLTAIVLSLLPFVIIGTIAAIGFHLKRRFTEPEPGAAGAFLTEPATAAPAVSD